MASKYHPLPDVAVFVFWKSEPPRPARAPPKERPVDPVVVVAVVPPKLFRVNPVEAIESKTVSLQKETAFLRTPYKTQNRSLKKKTKQNTGAHNKIGSWGKNYSIKIKLYILKNKEKWYLQSKHQ